MSAHCPNPACQSPEGVTVSALTIETQTPFGWWAKPVGHVRDCSRCGLRYAVGPSGVYPIPTVFTQAPPASPATAKPPEEPSKPRSIAAALEGDYSDLRQQTRR